MLSGIASYFFGAGEETEEQQQQQQQQQPEKQPLEPRLQTRYADENCDWIIVEKSTRGRSEETVEASPMENLLIEHPSMSVYGPRGRNSSTGVESDMSESSNDNDTAAAGPERPPKTQAVHRCAPRRPHAVAQRAGLIAHVETVKAVQRAVKQKERRQMSRNHLERSNRVRETQSRDKHQRRKDFMLRPSGRSNDKRC